MSTEIYLGEPSPRVKEWIRKHHKQNQFNFLYKKEGNTEWQEWTPQPDDIQIVDEKTTVKATGFKAMDGFADVREVKLPNKWKNGSEVVDVTNIGQYAFEDCSGLTSVTIPDSVTSIGSGAFFGCSSLASVTIPDSITCIEFQAFFGCDDLTSITIPDSATSIGDYAFSNCYCLTSITIPDSVTSIGEYAFSECSGLTSVEFEGNAPTVGADAFIGVASGCKAIISPTATGFPAAGETWNGLIVEIKDQFNFLYKRDGDTAWQEYAPTENDIDVVDGKKTIAATDFKAQNWFGDVREVVLPNKWNNGTEDVDITSIGDSAFRNCTGLTSVTIPDGVTSIEWGAFYGCSGLASVTIGNSVTSIGGSAFSGCSEFLFDTTTIPGVKLVDGWVVGYTNALSGHLDLTGSRGIQDVAFLNCSSLTGVTIPVGMTSIGNSAFNNCANLTDVTIPDSVTSIGFRAFYKCNGLTSLTIPGSVTSIGEEAFCYCRLTSVEFEGNAPAVGSDAFALVVFGCKAVVSSTATGFPAAGETWNGLIVEVKS